VDHSAGRRAGRASQWRVTAWPLLYSEYRGDRLYGWLCSSNFSLFASE